MLNKKVIRDIWKNKSQFITIFLMIFLAVFAFSGVHAYMDGMKKSSTVYYKNQNLQDIWLTSENFTEEKLNEISKIDNVKKIERAFAINANVNGSEKYINPVDNKAINDLVLECNFIEENEINKMYLIEGEEFSKDKSGLWLDYYLAKNLKINVGEELELSFNGNILKEKVMGLVEVPDHVYFIKDDTAIFPTHTDFGFCYMSSEELEKIVTPMFPYAIVDVEDETKVEETKKIIQENVEGIATATLREDNVSYEGYKREAEEGETYSGVFSGLFVFIAILSVVTTMNRFVKKERQQIGTLKALGFKKRKITKMYVNYGFFISIIASFLGIILGRNLIGKFFLKMEMDYYEIPYYEIVTIPEVYYMAIGIIIVITFVTYLSCRKILKEPAAQALRIESPNIKVKEQKNNFTEKFSLATKWNIRDMMRSKARSLMAVVGVAGCTMLVVTAFGMFDSMKAYVNWEFEIINNFKYKLSLTKDCSEEQLKKICESYGNATSETEAVEFKSNEKVIMKTLTINDSNNLLQLTDHNKKPIKMDDDGVYVTEKMAEIYNLKVGDSVEWHLVGSEQWYTTKIVGLNRDPQSQNFNCTKNFYNSIGEEYKPDSIYTNEDLSQVKELDGVNTIQSIENLENGMNNMLSMMYSLIALLIVVSVILACVIIYNLGVLSFSEKEYQFATLKVLGFKYKQIKKIFIKQNIWITVFAIFIALPLGNIMTDFIFKNAIGDTYDFSAQIKLATFVFSAIGTYIVSYFVNQILARKIKKINMVSSLKGNE